MAPFTPINRTLKDTMIHHARVVDVDMSTYSLTVATEFTKNPLSGISFATPYQHFINGEGIYFMPEVGSLCWLCEPSDGSRPFIIAWAPGQDEGDFRSRKESLNPGDIYMGTRDENFLVLRRGGIVQIGGGPLSQRIFMPVQNTIKDLCENYSLQTLAGNLEWTVAREEGTTDGDRPCNLTITAREKASDLKPIAQLQIGSHGEGSDTILSLLVKKSGEDGADTQVSLVLEKTGNVKWEVKKDVTWTVTEKFTVEAKQDISLKSNAKVKVEGSQGVEVKGATVKAESDGTLTLKAGGPASVEGSVIQLGGSAASSPFVKGDSLLSWLASHTHNATSIGAPTSPPLQAGALGSILSTTILGK